MTSDPTPNMERAVRQRLAEIRQERQKYLQAAERQMAAFDGAIQALEALLQGDAPAAPVDVDAEV